MSEEPTEHLLNGDLKRILERLESIDSRFATLEEKVDRRLQETRPMWESVQAQIRKLDTKFDIVIKELYEIRYDHVMLGQRVDELEKVRS